MALFRMTAAFGLLLQWRTWQYRRPARASGARVR